MRSSYLIAFLITLCGAGVFWYQSTAAVCPVPLSYRIGNIDSSFAIDEAKARSYAAQAEAVWENAVNRELFVYDPDAPLAIEFVYDDRQAGADSEAVERAALDAKQKESESIQTQLKNLENQYQVLLDTYHKNSEAYEDRLASYNEEVQQYNDRGGAPEDVYASLEAERQSLEKEAEALTASARSLESLATEINELVERGNSLVTTYNREVERYNEAFGFAREFTQGDYQGDSIHVYKFSTEAELVTVLAHEFGHALGFDHVEESGSLMYYLLENTDETPELSVADRELYEVVCGYEETLVQKIRRVIRTAIIT